MSDIDVAAIREALAKATPGPWRTHDSKYVAGKYVTLDQPNAATIVHATETWAFPPDAELIVLLRNNAEALLDAVEELGAAQAALVRAGSNRDQAERCGAVKALREAASRIAELAEPEHGGCEAGLTRGVDACIDLADAIESGQPTAR